MPKSLADSTVPPAVRRWSARLGLALVVAIILGYAPSALLARDPRIGKLRPQIDQLDAEGKQLAVENAALAREVEALRTDVTAVEDRARADLGMVYPDEIVIELPGGAP